MAERFRSSILALCTLLMLVSGVSGAHASSEGSGAPPAPMDHSTGCGGGPAEPASDEPGDSSMPCCDGGQCLCPLGTVSAVASPAEAAPTPRSARIGDPIPPPQVGMTPQRLLRPPIR